MRWVDGWWYVPIYTDARFYIHICIHVHIPRLMDIPSFPSTFPIQSIPTHTTSTNSFTTYPPLNLPHGHLDTHPTPPSHLPNRTHTATHTLALHTPSTLSAFEYLCTICDLGSSPLRRSTPRRTLEVIARKRKVVYIRARRSGAGIVINAKVVAKGRRERGYVSGVGA